MTVPETRPGAVPVMTVAGPVPSDGLGLTLTHEHLRNDVRKAVKPATDPALAFLRDARTTPGLAWLLRERPYDCLDHCTLDDDAALEVTAVHSVAGVLPADCPLITRPPFRDPHHTTSVAALVGGGSGMARPGQASLAHRGVLFLDEAPEFASGVLDALRQPLESGQVTIARSGGVAQFPARFLLVLAANPCGCATAGTPTSCTCSPLTRRRYLAKLSGPLLDRVDLQVRMDPVSRADLLADRGNVEPTEVVAARVSLARGRAERRFAGTPWRTNSEIPGRELRGRWTPARSALRAAERALDLGRLSARGLDRVLRVAWTLADLAEVDRPGADEVDEALYLRTGVAA